MNAKVTRQTIDLSAYPDLVVILLGMRANSFRGFLAMMRLGPQIKKGVEEKPDGLLLHEDFFFSFFPPHAGMRQYWRDFESLEKWSRELPHQGWWKDFLKDPKGTGFWHETYFISGGVEAIYDNMPKPPGLLAFAPSQPARGPMFSARKRAGREGEGVVAAPIAEEEFYGEK